MERRKTEDVTQVLLRFMREAGLESPLAEYRLIQAWAKVVGDIAARATTALYIRNQALHAHLNSPALKANLMMQRSRLVEALNREAGRQVITEIILE
jgi:predicted nucleic acid-binding Zn ribbon protein